MHRIVTVWCLSSQLSTQNILIHPFTHTFMQHVYLKVLRYRKKKHEDSDKLADAREHASTASLDLILWELRVFRSDNCAQLNEIREKINKTNERVEEVEERIVDVETQVQANEEAVTETLKLHVEMDAKLTDHGLSSPTCLVTEWKKKYWSWPGRSVDFTTEAKQFSWITIMHQRF